MIDWIATGVEPGAAKNRDKVIVICEGCSNKRQIVYSAAKRSPTHRCMSCVKKVDQFVAGQIVTYQCMDCPVTKKQAYRAHRFKSWRCHHCALKKAHKDGKISHQSSPQFSKESRESIGEAAKARWQDSEYRRKFAAQRATTKEKRSAISKEIWSDPARLEASRLRCADPEYRKRMAAVRASQPRISSIQEQLYRYLDDLGVEYFKESQNTVIGWYTFDCLIPQTKSGKKLLIECQGEYWHNLDGAASKDKSKFTYIDRYFPDHEIMYIWEHEFHTHGRVLDRLKLKLGLDVECVDFDFKDIIIYAPDATDLKSFLDTYHYIGKDRGGIAVGARLGNELIGCAVFSPPLRQNTAGQFRLDTSKVRELSRLCIHPAYHKRNFGSWLISKALKMANCELVIAYADRTIGHNGTVYKAAGFQEHHRVPPDYWYVDCDGFIMHKRTLYGRACRLSMTEAEYAEKNGFRKKYGGDKICFIKQLR